MKAICVIVLGLYATVFVVGILEAVGGIARSLTRRGAMT